MRTNKPVAAPLTHGGVKAKRISPQEELRRSVLASFLFEGTFYEDGQDHAARVEALSKIVKPQYLADLANEARNVHNLRHISLLLGVLLVERRDANHLVAETIFNVVQRADELAEFVALYWRNKKQPLTKQMKVGLGRAFNKFNAYQFAKYNRDNAVKLRDVLFLSHAKPKDDKQAAIFKQLVDNTLPTPDTWEVRLSGGQDKKEAFEELISTGDLGYLALLRNLRNMDQAGVNTKLVEQAIIARKGGAERVLPFRFTAAARAAPAYRNALENAMLARIDQLDQFDGHTIILVDVSGSMDQRLSAKSDLSRADAASTLACMFPGSAEVISFSTKNVHVKNHRGLRGIDNILQSQPHSSTYLAEAVAYANKLKHDRLIVITDEQATGGGYYGRKAVPDPVAPKAYMINVGTYQNGVGYRAWTHIDGFSENVLTFMREYEK